MTPRGRHPATTATVPRPELPQARLVLGAAAAAVGLFVALHWIVLPGDHVSLDQKNRRTESVTALDSAPQSGSRRKAAADVATGARRGAYGRAAAVKARKGQAAKTAPRTAGKPIVTSPGTARPGAPGAGDPPASGSDSPASTETPPAGQSSPPPPPSLPPPVGVPQLLTQLPDVPQVPQVPVPTVPDLPKPQVPTVPTPPVPSLP
jgi:hypothetical protein